MTVDYVLYVPGTLSFFCEVCPPAHLRAFGKSVFPGLCLFSVFTLQVRVWPCRQFWPGNHFPSVRRLTPLTSGSQNLACDFL